MAEYTLFPSIVPEDSVGSERDQHDRLAITIENGHCPWCGDYSGSSVPQHASSAHPDEWRKYKEQR